MPPRFAAADVTREVCALVRSRFSDHPGVLDEGALPATRADAEALWSHARLSCLSSFGPFEDAMSTRPRSLFHTRVSALLNIYRLLPRRVVHDVATDDDVPLASREAFVRQVLGWREFVRHVHVATDGFRAVPSTSVLGAHEKLPAAWWPSSGTAHAEAPWRGAPSGLSCLDHVVDDVWSEGYSHHITRLMVLGNIATLLDVEPRALSDWFWVAYVDAYD